MTLPFCKNTRAMVALIVFWALEILILQQWTTAPDGVLAWDDLIKDVARRFILNLASCSVLALLLPRWALHAVFLIGLIMTNLLVIYAGYFGAPLSWPVLSSQWREGLAVSDHGMSLLDWRVFAIGIVALGVKVAMATSVSADSLSRRERLKWGSIAGGIYLAFAIGLAGIHKPLERIHVGTPEYTYGYVVAWTAEAISLDNNALLHEAIAKAKASSDVLSQMETPLRLSDKIAIIQVESLDFDAIHSDANGEAVMPFLRRVENQAMVYSVKPFHDTGSSEADFSVLATATPNGKVNPFQIDGFPYAQALPWLAQQQGYRSAAFHGNTGEFFHRREAYEQMGFSNLYFSEELEPLSIAGEWDHELLDLSADLMATSTEPTLHFLITITSHGPFDRLSDSQEELFEEPVNVQQHYLNSMRYVDQALEDYVARLPEHTTIVIYGDHESNVQGYCSHPTHRDRVPWLIFQKGCDLSRNQISRKSGLALSGQLSQLDMVCYLRDRLADTQAGRSKVPSRQIAIRPRYHEMSMK